MKNPNYKTKFLIFPIFNYIKPKFFFLNNAKLTTKDQKNTSRS
ncbi:Hypothetical Protein SLY_1119 [Strawberry lethal yellows phytoplasma (CPA) str. NZSb11]|uniref:Uncharacterized protein n=1 Tax=Strawberry lethal yellows phytoplasma (CPA) str. NZSb11 TaxID=980422 RepID=R4RNS1_PHYAS|nr:Hypothetical Protein SLY_1119 [Strawberry lethal yellows phytoplasma (CPA) str. NZSb11]